MTGAIVVTRACSVAAVLVRAEKGSQRGGVSSHFQDCVCESTVANSSFSRISIAIPTSRDRRCILCQLAILPQKSPFDCARLHQPKSSAIITPARLTSINSLRRRLRRYRRLVQARHMRSIGMSRVIIVFSGYVKRGGGVADSYLDRCFRLVIVIIEEVWGVVYLATTLGPAK